MSWLALTLTCTLLAGAWTVHAARHRGAASALRGAGITLAFPALYLTDTLGTLGDIGGEIASWATRLVFSPSVWLGVVLAGISALLLGASSVLRSRELARGQRSGELPPADRGAAAKPSPEKRSPEKPSRRSKGSGDPELDEIEELLRRRGIS